MAQRRSAGAAQNLQFRVTAVSEAGNDRVNVTFSQVNVDAAGQPLTPTGPVGGLYVNSISLNLTAEDAAGYFPGQLYDMSLTAVAE